MFSKPNRGSLITGVVADAAFFVYGNPVEFHHPFDGGFAVDRIIPVS